MNINKINKIAQDNIAQDNEKNLKSAEGFERIGLLLDVADENKLNDKDTNKLIDAFEELGVDLIYKYAFKNMIYNFNFTLKDTTPYGNVYFSRVFEIQGIIREMWLKKNNLLNSLKDYQLITKKAHNEYIKECFPFVNYEAELIVKKINRASFIFEVEIKDQKTGEIHCKGGQKICFDKENKLAPIPEAFKKALILNKNKNAK